MSGTKTTTLGGNASGNVRDSLNGILPVVLFGVAYIILYLIFMPSINAIMDESAYLTLAYAMRHGTIFLDQVGLTPPMSYEVGGHVVSQYPPGMPAVVALFSLLGWKFSLATNLFVHLTSYAIVARILKKLDVAPGYAVLYLLHPTAVIYSRTVMSDLSAGLLIALAFLCFLNRRYALVGAVVGISVLIRTANAALLLPFLMAAFLERGGDGETLTPAQRFRSIIVMGISAIPFVALAWLYQNTAQHGGWARYSASVSFGLVNIPKMLPGYMLDFMVLYPAMLLAPAFYRGPARIAVTSLTYFCLLFYSCSAFTDVSGSVVETFILGQRYVLVIIPVFIVAYAWGVSQLVTRFRKVVPERVWTILIGLVIAVLFTIAGLIHQKHQKYLQRAEFARARFIAVAPPGDVVYVNVHLAKLLHPAWGEPKTARIMGLDLGTMNGMNRVTMQEIWKEVSSGKKVTVAIWSRKFRVETESELKLLKDIRDNFVTEPIIDEAGPGGEEVLIALRIVGEKTPIEGLQ